MTRRIPLLLATSLAVACSGSSSFGPDDLDATADLKGGSDALMLPDVALGDEPSSDDAAVGTDAGPDNPDLACVTDDAGCESCCLTNHPDGAATYFNTLFTCACSTGATCHSVSACYGSLCKGGGPSNGCNNCLQNPDAGDCDNKAGTACGGDPDCVALSGCLSTVCPSTSADASSD